MRIEGKVSSKTENASGHSQVRISCTAVLVPGTADAKPAEVEVILSTPSVDVVAAFRIGQSVSFDL